MEKMRRMNIIPLKCRCRTGYNPGLMFFVNLRVRRGLRLASRPWVRLVPG